MNPSFPLQKFVAAATRQLEQYLTRSHDGTGRVLQQRPAAELAKTLRLDHWIQHGGITPEAFEELLETYLEHTQHLHHPGYIGHQVSVPHPSGGLSGLINGIVSNPMGIYEMGPASATMERVVVNWLLGKLGWHGGAPASTCEWQAGWGGGVLTNGGSVANLTALSAARAAIAPEAWVEGSPDDLVVMASEAAHYSISRAVSLMGMGQKAIIPIPVDNHERLRPETLETVYEKIRQDGQRVMAVVANACATSTGLYDPLDEVAAFCEAQQLWYHVDGAHGAAALLSPEEAHFMNGAQRASSMILDAHKMLQVESLCAAVLCRDHRHLENAFRQKGSYLFHDKEQPGFDMLSYTVECTKNGLGPKLFWTLAVEGERGLGDYVHHQYKRTREFHAIIDAHPDFQCFYKPEANILCFRFTKAGEDNATQLAIRNEVVRRGAFYITSAEVRGVRYLRLTVMNQRTTTQHLHALLEEIQHAAEAVASV